MCVEIGAGRKLREKCKRGSKCNDENASAGVKVGSNCAGTISAHEFQGAATSSRNAEERHTCVERMRIWRQVPFGKGKFLPPFRTGQMAALPLFQALVATTMTHVMATKYLSMTG